VSRQQLIIARLTRQGKWHNPQQQDPQQPQQQHQQQQEMHI